MSPAGRPNIDVVDYKRTPVLDEAALEQLRQCEDPEYVPETNLFRVMFEDGRAWVSQRADRFYTDAGENRSQFTPEEYAVILAREATVDIQQEYDVCLPDDRIGQMYGMSHDFARLALGIRIPAPGGQIRKPKSPVMHRKRILEYAKEPR